MIMLCSPIFASNSHYNLSDDWESRKQISESINQISWVKQQFNKLLLKREYVAVSQMVVESIYLSILCSKVWLLNKFSIRKYELHDFNYE